MTAADLSRMLLLAALWGASFMFMRVVVPVLGAVPTTVGRVALGAAGLLAVVLLMRVPRDFRGRGRATLMLGVVNSGLPFLLFALAARVLPAGYSAILNAMTPLMGILIGALAFGERVTAPKLAGVLLGLAGVAVLTQTGPVQMTAATAVGVGACLLATLCYALAGFLTRRWISDRGGLDSRLVALGSQTGALLFTLPFLAWQAAQAPLPWAEATALVWGALAILGLACTSLAYILYFRLIADLGAVRAMSVTFLIPLFGVLWGWLLLGEVLSLAHGVGGGLIALALWLVLRAPAPASPR